MKKLVNFALSFGIAFFAFIIVAFAVFLFSGSLGSVLDGLFPGIRNNRQTKLEPPQNAQEVVKNAELLLMLEADQRLYLSVAEISLLKGDFWVVVKRNAEDDCKELYSKLENDGLYAFSDSAKRALAIPHAMFIKFDEESFAKTTDRLNGVVYNKKDKQLLLTGSQAVEVVDNETFHYFCEQLLQKAFEGNAEQEFLFVANRTENSLSYPKFYEFYY